MSYPEVKSVAELAGQDGEYRAACEKIVISHAVNELFGASVFDEPAIALAPDARAKWLSCRIAMEEYHHHLRMRDLAQEMGIAPERYDPQKKEPLTIFSFQLASWEEFCVIKLLADLGEILQVEDLLSSSFQPLKNFARMTLPEEKFHAQFGLDSCTQLIATDAGRARVQDAINRYFPLLPAFFGADQSKNNETFRRFGLKQRSNEAMRSDYLARAQALVETKLGLTLPKLAGAT